ncbi:MAG TPA: hypothetical protein VLT88_06045 [Desulfosarcina sp.]|nr:hypothetical protein [Desulfosarcina sp.]
MGEIKSTLDLVMERTRHLSLSDEERVRQRKEEFGKRLQGLLQQFADGGLSTGDLHNRIADLRAELAVKDRRPLVAGIAGRIDPDQDNRRWLDLLAETAPSLVGPLEAALAELMTRKHERLKHGERRLRDRLAATHAIEGPAAVPNPLKDEGCRADLAALRHQFTSRLKAIVDQDAPPPQT